MLIIFIEVISIKYLKLILLLRASLDLSLTFIKNLFYEIKSNVERANEAGEDPYDAVVKLQKGNAIIFSGNLSNILHHLAGYVLDESHILAINSHPHMGAILEEGKHWYVNVMGLLAHDRDINPNVEVTFPFCTLFSSGHRRTRMEILADVEHFDCTIMCK